MPFKFRKRTALNLKFNQFKKLFDYKLDHPFINHIKPSSVVLVVLSSERVHSYNNRILSNNLQFAIHE